MARKRAELGRHEEVAALRARLRREPAGRWRERLQAVVLGLEGEFTLVQIAHAVSRSRATVQSWFDRYRRGGLEALLADGRLGNPGGPASRLTPVVAEALQEALAAGQFRTGPRARRWLAEAHGVDVALATVYTYLGKAGARLRVPRPVQEKKDPVAASRFKAELTAKLLSLNLKRGRPVRFWVADEMRFGLHSFTRRVWGLRGYRTTAPVQQKYQWGYCWGAVEVGRGGSAFLYTDTVCLEWNAAFLSQIGNYDPGAQHVVIYDGAGFHHRPDDPRLPANVHPVLLPAYSPELNPVEKLWDQAKDVLCNRVYPSIAALQADLTGFLEHFWTDARRPFRLIGTGSYLLASANNSGATIIPI